MPVRLSQEEVIRFFRKNGLNPLEDYQGIRIACKSQCLTCRKEVTPTLASLKAGRGGCAYCAGKKVDPKDAFELFKSRGLKPQVPYPGSKVPWKSLHLKCGEMVFPTFNKIQQGQSGCMSCSGLAKKSEEAAVKFFKSKGLSPLEPYKNNISKWKSQHTECGNTVYPRYGDVQQGHTGCIYCAFRVNDKAARKLFLSVGLKPLIEFPGSVTAWPSIHDKCGKLVSPMYSNIQQGKGPCDYCGGGQPIDPTEAIKLFLTNGFKPLEDFKKAKSPWKSLHKICNGVVYPSYSRIANGGGVEFVWKKAEYNQISQNRCLEVKVFNR
jgi:formylmethanofuran dehydrogenase subunit E